MLQIRTASNNKASRKYNLRTAKRPISRQEELNERPMRRQEELNERPVRRQEELNK